mmetsp:Transcript_26075/g.46309  ORF Transcript_26075/g.46309 Transcript_26075/m.46309 type:complete len:154 (+) Transcript_26075:4002-4463(+)
MAKQGSESLIKGFIMLFLRKSSPGVLRKYHSRSDEIWPLLKRELVADAIQCTTRGCIYYYTSSASVKADLMRTALETVNHMMLAATNWVAAGVSSEKGMPFEKTKNAIVTLPGIFFFMSGAYNILNPLSYLALGASPVTHSLLPPLALVVNAT